jgi:excisionase family DNA binding protein
MKQQPISGNSATSLTTPTPARADDLLTPKELAGKLKISIRTVRRWEHLGMPAHRRRRLARYPLAQVREWMKATDRR